MIESAIGIVAACLPTLRPLVHGFSIQSIFQNVRSVISLPLLGGKDSTARTGYGKSYNDAANENSSSQVGLKNEIFIRK